MTKAYELIASKKHWTQGELARDGSGDACLPCDPGASAWCLMGAIAKCHREDYLECLRVLRESLGFDPLTLGAVSNWNDHPDRKHREVVDLLKEVDL